LSAAEVLKVIYAPHKALKEIIQKPKYVGPLLIIILLVITNLGFTYEAISKTYVEQTLPNGSALDQWTEDSTFWTSNAQVTESSDQINGTYYGNASISFSTLNSTQAWMQLQGIGSINCSGPNGYNESSFRIKWTSPTEKPENVTIQLFSANSSDYFYLNLVDNFSNATYNIWNNLTIPLASTEWLRSGSNADWGNITGLRLEFTWPSNSNITVLVDGLFFHGVFKSLLETAGTTYLLNYGLFSITQYAVTWVLLSGMLYIIARGVGGKLVWKPLLIAVGFILITMFIQTLINTITYLTLPTLYYPFAYLGGVSGEGQTAYDTIVAQTLLVSQISSYLQIAVYVWTIALCTLTVRLLAGLTWSKSLLVGAIGYLVTLLIEGFILG
jgi:hypothetical protein